MKNFLNILSICAIFLSFGAIKAIGNDLDEVICNAMKGMQAQEEKKIPYKIGKYELIGLTVSGRSSGHMCRYSYYPPADDSHRKIPAAASSQGWNSILLRRY